MSVVYKPGVTERNHERQLFTVCYVIFVAAIIKVCRLQRPLRKPEPTLLWRVQCLKTKSYLVHSLIQQ